MDQNHVEMIKLLLEYNLKTNSSFAQYILDEASDEQFDELFSHIIKHDKDLEII